MRSNIRKRKGMHALPSIDVMCIIMTFVASSDGILLSIPISFMYVKPARISISSALNPTTGISDFFFST